MPTLTPGDIPLVFGGANPAAAASESALWPMGLADVNDVDGYRMPVAGVVVGVSLNGAPAAGDTMTVQPRINTTNVTGVTAQITNSTTSATDLAAKDDDATQRFAAGDIVKCRYTTTTGGTYTVKDVAAIVWVRPFLYP